MRPLLPLLAAAASQLPVPAQAGPRTEDRVLVCNKVANTLSILSPAERREVASVPTGRGPHEVAVASDGAVAVVSDYGDRQPGHSLTVVDVVAGKVLRTIDLPRTDDDGGDGGKKRFLRPHGVQFVAPRRVVVTSEAARRLLLVDVDEGRVVRTWPTPQPSMHMVSVARDGRRAAASSVADGTVVFFDLGAEGTTTPKAFATGEGAEGLAVHPTRGEAWIGNRGSNTLSVVARTGEVLATLPTGEVPFRVAFTPDGANALVTCAESGELLVFDANERALVAEVSLHGDRSEESALPLGIACDPEGRLAYVTCGRGEYVAVVDLEQRRVVDRLTPGGGPDGIAYARPRAAEPRDGAVRR